LEWHLLNDPRRQGLMDFVNELGALYRANSCFWRRDHEPSGFAWIDVGDKEQSVLSYSRWDGVDHMVVVLNLTPIPREGYRLGAPASGSYRMALNSDDERFGGSGFSSYEVAHTEAVPNHGFPNSMILTLPPLSVIVLRPEPGTEPGEVIKGEGWVKELATPESQVNGKLRKNKNA
ncbi:MAG: alpha amylase C-terminal domain-containing protein, partial [Gemmatimonadaceae bacterium]